MSNSKGEGTIRRYDRVCLPVESETVPTAILIRNVGFPHPTEQFVHEIFDDFKLPRPYKLRLLMPRSLPLQNSKDDVTTVEAHFKCAEDAATAFNGMVLPVEYLPKLSKAEEEFQKVWEWKRSSHLPMKKLGLGKWYEVEQRSEAAKVEEEKVGLSI